MKLMTYVGIPWWVYYVKRNIVKEKEGRNQKQKVSHIHLKGIS